MAVVGALGAAAWALLVFALGLDASKEADGAVASAIKLTAVIGLACFVAAIVAARSAALTLSVVILALGALTIATSVALLAANAPGADVVDADDLPARQADRPRPIVLDEIRGSYRGTTIGDRRSEARRRHGPSQRPAGSDDSGPVGSDEDGTPGSWNPPGSAAVSPPDLDYRGRSYLVEQRPRDPRVYGIIVTDRRAQTSRGVGIGDTLAFALQRYTQLRCDVVGPLTEYVRPPFAACHARIAARRYLAFGKNPIRSITLMTVPFDEAG